MVSEGSVVSHITLHHTTVAHSGSTTLKVYICWLKVLWMVGVGRVQLAINFPHLKFSCQSS